MKKVKLPVSKSLYIRKLVCDFLNRHQLDEVGVDFPADVRIVRACLARIAEAESERNETENPVCIDVRDCGAAYRFLMAVLAVTPGSWILTGTPRLMQRPIEELVEALRSIGAAIQRCPCKDAINRVSNGGGVYPCLDIRPCVSTDNSASSDRDAMHCVSTNDMLIPNEDGARPVSANENGGGWLIHGKPLHAPELTIDCTRSGQFATALLLIADTIGLQKLHVLPENPTSAAYIAMTKAVISGEADLAPQRMGDWSAAVYWYARLLLSQRNREKKRQNYTSTDGTVPSYLSDVSDSYKLLHLDLHSIQSDAVVAHWFSQWGVVSRQEEDGVVIEYDEDVDIQNDMFESDESGNGREDNDQDDTIVLDMSQNLDLVPVLACMACLWPKKMVFNGVANLKYKESNRLKVIQEELSKFAEIELNAYDRIDDNQLVINPICCRDGERPVSTNENCSNKSPIVFSFDAHNDHRFVMGFSLFALKGKVQINGFDCVRKSYPDFKAEGVVAGTDVVG